MGPDDIEELDEKPLDGNEASETVRDDKPVSVRDSIRSALKEHAEDDADDKDDKEIKATPEKKKPVKASKDDNDEEDAGDDDTSKKDKKEPVVKEPKDTTEKVETVEKKEKAPASLPKEVTAEWDKLPSNVQTYLTKAQKDLTDTKSMLGRIQSQSREMDQVIAQYEPSIRQLGVTPAQTVDRLFQWMNGLSGPHKVSVARQLLQNFGIDLNQQQQQQDVQDNQQQQQQQQQYAPLDPQYAETLNSLHSEVNALKTQQQQARERNAAETVNSWAGLQADGTYKNKPHYDKVRQSMFSLMASGAVPMIKDSYGNDRLDLDGAYEAACYANAEVRAALEQEKQEQLKEQQTKDAEAKKQREKDKVLAARKASGSIRPGAPAALPNSNPAPKKGANGTVSVRDSIKHAIRESSAN